jgi:hypothetical protein
MTGEAGSVGAFFAFLDRLLQANQVRVLLTKILVVMGASA